MGLGVDLHACPTHCLGLGGADGYLTLTYLTFMLHIHAQSVVCDAKVGQYNT